MRVISYALLFFTLASCAFYRDGLRTKRKKPKNVKNVAISLFIDLKWTPISQINKGESSLVTDFKPKRYLLQTPETMDKLLEDELRSRFLVYRNKKTRWEQFIEIEMIDTDVNFEAVSLYRFFQFVTAGIPPQVSFKREYIIRSLFTYDGEPICEFIFRDEIKRLDSLLLLPIGPFFTNVDVYKEMAKDFASGIHTKFFNECAVR